MSLRARLSLIRSSFQFKLFFLFTLLTAVITSLSVTLFVVHQIHEDRRHASEKLQLLAKALADSIRLPLYAENRDLLQGYAEQALRLPEIRGVEISGANMSPLVKLSTTASAADLADCLVDTVEVRSSPLLFLSDSIPLKRDDARGALVGRVRLYRGTEDLARAGHKFVATAVSVAILFWLLISCSSFLLLRRVTRSFQALMLGLRNVHGGDYVSRIEVLSDDEPGKASASVNQLADSLQRRDEENRLLNAELLASMELEIASGERLISINRELEKEIDQHSRVKQELRNLVEQLPVGIIWSDANGTIERLNNFMCERIGYGHEEVRCVDDWLSLVCPDELHRQGIAAMRNAAISSCKEGAREVAFYDVRVLCKDGTLRELNCSNQLSGTRTVDIMIDMTDRELLQRQIVRNQKLESIGILASGIAHNFNNALTGVMGYISFARKFVDESDRAHELLLKAEKATHRAAGLANQLLTFANGGAPIKKAISLLPLVDDAVAVAVKGSRVAGCLQFPPTLPYVLADGSQLHQAFNCICVNAVQAMPEGGTLTVRGRRVSTDDEKLPVPAAGDFIELCFEDQGTGIRDQDKPNIFTPYFTTKAELGTGLGLATVHSIVARHGGAITFDTMLGKGTTFTLYLPVARSAAPEEGEVEPQAL